VGQHDAEEIDFAALAIVTNNTGTFAEVDLSPFTRFAFEAAKWQFGGRRQLADEAPDAVVSPGKAMVDDQVLIDALGAEAEVTLGLNRLASRIALASATIAALDSLRD
jgi:hypothetical protein